MCLVLPQGLAQQATVGVLMSQVSLWCGKSQAEEEEGGRAIYSRFGSLCTLTCRDHRHIRIAATPSTIGNLVANTHKQVRLSCLTKLATSR